MKWDRETAADLAWQTLMGIPVYESKNLEHWWDIYIGGQHVRASDRIVRPGSVAINFESVGYSSIQKCIIVGEVGHFKHILALSDLFRDMRNDTNVMLSRWESSMFPDSRVSSSAGQR